MTVALTTFPSKDAVQVNWSSMAKGQVSQAASIVGYSDMTIAVNGSFDTATVTVEGSNDGTNWHTLSDPLGNPLTFTAGGMKVIMENPFYIRISVNSAGAGTTSVVASLVGVN